MEISEVEQAAYSSGAIAGRVAGRAAAPAEIGDLRDAAARWRGLWPVNSGGRTDDYREAERALSRAISKVLHGGGVEKPPAAEETEEEL